MVDFGTISLIITALLVFWAIVIFNLLVRDKNRVLAAWSDIDVQLKRRHDLLPKLIDAVRQYAAYEKAVMEEVTTLRSRADQTPQVAEKARIEAAISSGIQRLIAVAEQYPELKANSNFLDLQRNIAETEDHIQFARRYYNGAVRNLNTRIDSFPDMMIARLFAFRHRDFFELDDESIAGQQGEIR